MTTYEKEFKEEAVKMAIEVGTAKAAKDLGIPDNTLYTWMKKARAHGELAHIGSGHKRSPAVSGETAGYVKRIKELEKANQILKEALGFFVVSQKK